MLVERSVIKFGGILHLDSFLSIVSIILKVS